MTFTPMGDLELLVNLSPLTARVWTVGVPKRTETRGEHANRKVFPGAEASAMLKYVSVTSFQRME